MLPRLSLKICDIKVINRQRLDLGDLSGLVESIQKYGLIQPIVVDQNRRLIAGGRRLEACKQLGQTLINVVFRETLTEDELHILELEENIQRKDETWQEQALHIRSIHFLKKKLKALDSESWGQRETGRMLGYSVGHLNYCLIIAESLFAEKDFPVEQKRYWACNNLADAWRLWCRDQEDLQLAELARRQKVLSDQQTDFTFNGITESTDASNILSEPLSPYEIAKQKYYLNPLNLPDSFDVYWKEREAFFLKNSSKIINLSKRFFLGDSIKFMQENLGRFDHIITDIPYGIDMVMLNSQHPDGQMRDLDTIEKEHDVKYNLQLIADFFPAAFLATKDNAFVITWADQMLWQYMYDHAIKAGFLVQRWPITWYKTSSCMNQCIAYNTTKNTEIAIVCRKPRASIVQQPQTSVIVTGRDELCSDIGHPFAKPFELWRFLIEAFTLENQAILDPFAGRGSAIVSFLRLNRNAFGVELNEQHYNALLENTKQLFYLKLDNDFIFT